MLTCRLTLLALAVCLLPYLANGQTTFFISHSQGPATVNACSPAGAFAINFTAPDGTLATIGTQRAVLNLTAGINYTFTTTTYGNFNPCHPFVITSSATGGGGAAALPAVTGGPATNIITAVSTSISWVPPAALVGNAAVFYQCGNHLNMGAQINILAAAGGANGTVSSTGATGGTAAVTSTGGGAGSSSAKAGASSTQPLIALIVSSVIAVLVANYNF